MQTMLSDWTFCAVGATDAAAAEIGTLPAQVPGCVHLDLMASGVIDDPYLDQNEDAVGWVGRTDWRYECEFDWTAEKQPRVDLVALGLDTLATIELNGEVIAATANQHRSYRFDVTERLRPGPNRLAIVFAAGEPGAERAGAQLGPRPAVGNAHPFNAIRKMASNYGWDWGPALITAGIWKAIFLHSWETVRIASVRPLVDVEDGWGILRAHVDLEWLVSDAAAELEVEVAGQRGTAVVAAGQTSAVVEVQVPDVERWWPRGYGPQPLYPVSVRLVGSGGRAELDSWSARVGFRTVALDTHPDDDGTPFTISVNDVEVFARGVNWIPEDCFPVRVDRARYADRLGQAVDAGVNLIRVWGGGLYESEDFYQLCDELGLLVWQDFLFACAAYAEEGPLASEVAAEAREAVTRLSRHPSLVLWNGNNENIWGHQEWGWREELNDASWGWGYYSRLLPQIVAELDPTRPYCPGSPYSMSPDLPPNDPAHGLMHQWEVWNRLDYTAYRRDRPRFASEFGWQGPPAWATLTRAVHDHPLTAEAPGVRAHQKADDGQGKLARGLVPHLPAPESFSDWHWATALNQARAVRTAVEWYRSLFPLCRGAIVWQLNDCWPAISWSAVDGDGRKKPMWFALRDVFADRLISVQPDGDALTLAVHNDHDQPWSGTVRVSRRSLDGTVLADDELPFALDARAAVRLPLATTLSHSPDPGAEFLLAEVAGAERAWWWFSEDRDSRLPVPDFDAAVEQVDGGFQVRVSTRTVLKDLALLADKVAPDAETDCMLITLLPGETRTIMVRTTTAPAPDRLITPEVLRSANQLVATARTPVG